MAGPSQRGHVKGGVLQEWRVGSNNLKEDRMLLKTLAMFDTQKRAFLTLLKADEIKLRIAEKRMMVKVKAIESHLTQRQYEWLAELERRGGMEKCVATLPDVNMKRIKQFARMKRLMTKDDVERHLSGHALTTKQQQLEALKERYEHAGQLDSTSEPKMASIDCHKVFKVKIEEREERQRRLQRGLDPVPDHGTRKDSKETSGGEGSLEDRMNELAAEKRKRRLKEEQDKFNELTRRVHAFRPLPSSVNIY